MGLNMNEEEITSVEKLIALVKGNLIGKVLSEKEYYYLMFSCKNDDDIKLIKSMTMDECKYYLDCCWYFDIDNPSQYQLDFMKRYRKFSPSRNHVGV